MTRTRQSQVFTHYEAWQHAEDSLRTKARKLWETNRKRAEDMIKTAERIKEDRLNMTIEYAGQY